ncbi:MAG TPA: hemerythrin domain-containing protein [Chitinophagaceae bacterium]|nr:hemerythrin domain-containing protein [Chitinophagaceae bacterium]MCC6635112.1 hemerythrin domain-containing protein [Chitinophagaceae bacterium]HMZ46915.1 hemerythrin domain-containing protein [Chitinophagaceae bacterium]HNE92738.1 hemerythrin domain-containing protein [Chitinophagaceae bacterium]HNF29295.1 hemerythrin domain-containing protein [Chitinophagaceae bacterium]
MNNIFNNGNKDNSDYIKRFVEKDTGDVQVYSPMDPPDAYKPQGVEPVPYNELHAMMQALMDEHKITLEKINDFEATLLSIKKDGVNKESNKKLGDFFAFIDEKIVLHNLKEERILFPLIHDRMIDNGEHGTGKIPDTAVDLLENDHIKMMELATLTFSLMGITSRITDPISNALLMDTAIEQGLSLVEMLRLHIFREDNVVFPLAHKYLTPSDYEKITHQMKKYFSIDLPSKN